MSQELEEKVALACFEVDLEWFAARNPDVPIEELRQHAKDDLATNYAAIARAALAVVREELRESTTEMLDSGWDETPPAWTPELNESGPQVMARVFAAMLSASPLGDDHE